MTAIEIDNDLKKNLEDKFLKNNRFSLIMGDFLTLDPTSYLRADKIKVVANIPYYITSPIINKLIENRQHISEIYIMVQKEVGERICAKKGKERSVLTLAVEFFGEAKYLFTIPKEYFTPIPNVDSAFISIILYHDQKYLSLIDEKSFFDFIKVAFSGKRKTIANNLTSLGRSKDEIKSILKELNISENERAENIAISDYISLIKLFKGGNNA